MLLDKRKWRGRNRTESPNRPFHVKNVPAMERGATLDSHQNASVGLACAFSFHALQT
jgi:hypothetical protein